MPRKTSNSLIALDGPILMERDDTFLVLHCQGLGPGRGHRRHRIEVRPSGCRTASSCRTRGGVGPGALNVFYNTADVYVSSGAEGFGLTIAEAIACGVPAVGLQYSAVPEVIGPAGMVVPVATLYDNQYDHFWAGPRRTR